MSEEAKHEIVIIRRGHHGGHDDHHGGAWKIAFADFMTAMMAFFLVMWLISANDKTRASVARYFNPVRLVDATTQPRGLHDPKKDESGITASSDTKDTKSESDDKKVVPDTKKGTPQAHQQESPDVKEKRLDATLRDNPYAALAEIAATKGAGDAPSYDPTHATASPAVIGRRGGEAFRDPFAPPRPSPPEPNDKTGDDDRTAVKQHEAVKAESSEASSQAKAVIAKQDVELEGKIKALAKAPGRAAAGPGVDVKRTSEGLLVSLTDTSDFSMFASGSAVPARPVVLMMEKVAQVLKSRPGTIVVRGYTDNKPYKSGHYDNWHLSLDRAQVAHYMLVRGGLEDTRLGHIEGYADRGRRDGVDPSSPVNRRIEILLKDNEP
jgi:chemotaxis protein MotB